MSKLVRLLISESGLNERDVRAIIATAPHRYKTYEIPKRNGGFRQISQPARELKVLQSILIQEILSPLPVHTGAKAYRQRISIRDNAAAHAGNGPILKFDFANFFPSIVAKDWISYCTKHHIFTDEEDTHLSANILFWRYPSGSVLRLAIGAPSSPLLSNVLMFDFDEIISQAVAKDHITYTRYADDLTFSAKRAGNLRDVETTLRRVIREVRSPNLKLNEEKTIFATKRYKRVVTGLVLADDGKVSLGRDRKRLIRAALHHYVSGKLDLQGQARLAGLLAFVNAVEPEFLEILKERYGSAAMNRLKLVPRAFSKVSNPSLS